MYCLQYEQKLPLSLDACWEFFSSPANLKIITPEHLEFEVKNAVDQKMYPGQIIVYTIRPFLGIPVEWVTEITHVQELEYFIDEQRFGPYAFWHHEHRFIPVENGVKMQDTIYYKLPLGVLGRALNALKIRKDIESIFSYRKKKLESLFGC